MLRRIALILFLALGLAGPAAAQTPFQPVAIVNDSAITGFDLAQRAQIMVALGFQAASADALRSEALERLINDRLKIQEAERIGIEPSKEAVEAGISEFTNQVGIGPAEFRALMNSQGVTDMAVEDFIGAEVAWRDLIRSRYLQRIDPGEAEIDAELGLAENRASFEFRVREIGLPNDEDGRGEAATRQLAEDLYDRISAGQQDFDAAVARYSRAPSAARGGDVGWVSTGRLPPELVGSLATLEVGQITRPIPVAGGFSILKLMDRRRTGSDSFDATDPALREQVRQRLIDQQIARLAEGLLQELRRDALIQVK